MLYKSSLLFHSICFSFFLNDSATPEIYTLSLHDALPICEQRSVGAVPVRSHGLELFAADTPADFRGEKDRKSTRLNSSHVEISYAVFCLKKKKNNYLAHDNNTVIMCAAVFKSSTHCSNVT